MTVSSKEVHFGSEGKLVLPTSTGAAFNKHIHACAHTQNIRYLSFPGSKGERSFVMSMKK